MDDILCLGRTVNSQQQQNKWNKIQPGLGIELGASPSTRPIWQLNILMEVKPLLFRNIFRRCHSKTNFWLWLDDFAFICKSWWPYWTISWIAKFMLMALLFHIQLNFVKANFIKTNNTLRRSESSVPNWVLLF